MRFISANPFVQFLITLLMADGYYVHFTTSYIAIRHRSVTGKFINLGAFAYKSGKVVIDFAYPSDLMVRAMRIEGFSEGFDTVAPYRAIEDVTPNTLKRLLALRLEELKA